MVSPQFRPTVGGYERAAERLSAALAQLGHGVTVLTDRRERAWATLDVMNGFTVRRLFSIWRPGLHGLSLAASYAFFLLAHGRRFHIVHCHQYGLIAGVALVLGRFNGSKTVMKITSTGPSGIATMLEGRSWRARLLRWAHRLLDGAIVTSADAEREARDFFLPHTRICRIPNGIELGSFGLLTPPEKADLRARLKLGDGPVAIYVGRLQEEKNILGLLEAWRAVAARFTSAQLVVIGDGPQRASAEAMAAKHGNQGSVLFCGELPDVSSWYQAADVFVLPSVFEGLSNSLIEAMSSGLGVVSTDVSGSRDIFRETDIGEMVDCGDTNAFAAALMRLFDDPQRRRQCGQRARAYAEATFSLSVVASRTEEFYATVLRPRPRLENSAPKPGPVAL